ncbi:DNA polymerase III polC-type [Serratia proteamaculans]|uniref:3'-5' exonuclease n=1 Tax=Serratia proteamaculans TaxID=28151 RepID=UPI00217BEAA8|nr:3'-5' exonuclease [Serratia proteamaculans]CAI0809773.1 DNA polymerase III polC-type [Serratia proteamaculans]CAI1597065.1 DNA polymerase III polC-type [Serratia proteamaculans]
MTPQFYANKWIAENSVILDTETTGLGEDAEIVEICLIDCTGKILLNTLVKPKYPIPQGATDIHGITNDMVANAPTWPMVCAQFCTLVGGKTVVIYNKDYDLRLLIQTDKVWGVTPRFDVKGHPDFACAMIAYAEFYGVTDERRGTYKWQRLTAAADQQGVKIEGTAHRALPDCLTTLGVIKAMAIGGKAPGTLNAQSAVNTLQQLFKADTDAITALVDHRVECSEYFAAMTTATVGQHADGAYIVGLIGIINALIFPDVLAAVYDGNKLTGFTVADISAKAGDA